MVKSDGGTSVLRGLIEHCSAARAFKRSTVNTRIVVMGHNYSNHRVLIGSWAQWESGRQSISGYELFILLLFFVFVCRATWELFQVQHNMAQEPKAFPLIKFRFAKGDFVAARDLFGQPVNEFCFLNEREGGWLEWNMEIDRLSTE